jgi:D-sedoheptulose 7-phosphate isomerase
MNHLNLAQKYFSELQQLLQQIDLPTIIKFAQRLKEAVQPDQSIFIFGNGGCSSLASHFCADLGKMMKLVKNENYRIISLNDNIPSLTAWANDTGYENIFWRQLELYMKPGDLVFAMSGSGNSPNVIKAVTYAREHQNYVLSFSGFGGGKLAPLSDLGYIVPSSNMQIVEDAFGILLHTIFVALRDS